MAVAVSISPSPIPQASPPPRKRKRDLNVEDLEINVNAPEPPSKKALRKAKKANTESAHAVKQDRRKYKSVNSSNVEGNDSSPWGKHTSTKFTRPTAHPSPVEEPPPTKKERSPHGIWIGNLAFSTTKSSLRIFLTTNTSIHNENITRIHLPRTSSGTAGRSKLRKSQQEGGDTEEVGDEEGDGQGKGQNRGFAYVDFDSAEAVFEALQLSESVLDGRNVLIKDANNFEGRPTAEAGTSGATDGGNPSVSKRASSAKTKALDAAPKSKRIFLGNLPFDATPQDLQYLYRKSGGEITHLQVATFEDSGKCKGYAWIEFDNFEAAENARRGWVDVFEDDDDDDGEDEDLGEDDVDADVRDEDRSSSQSQDMNENDQAAKQQPKLAPNNSSHPKSKPKRRRIFMNRLHGRTLRAEYAEDKAQRYKKRFGKGASLSTKIIDNSTDSSTSKASIVDGDVVDGQQNNKDVNGGGGGENDVFEQPPAEGREQHTKKTSRIEREYGSTYIKGENRGEKKRMDARSMKPGAALVKPPRETGAIVEGQGKKVVFS